MNKRYECDCGAIYSNRDALMACQNARHGQPMRNDDKVSHLRAAILDMAEWAHAGFNGDLDETEALNRINNRGREILERVK